MLKKFVEGAVRPNVRGSGRQVMGQRPHGKPKVRVTIEAGVLYRLRRGSNPWFTWGDHLMMAVSSGTFTKGSGVQLMTPSGLITVSAGDIRPVHSDYNEEE